MKNEVLKNIMIILFALWYPIEAYAEIYNVTVTKSTPASYDIVGQPMYILTEYCNVRAENDHAVLQKFPVTAGPIGKITFSTGESCMVYGIYYKNIN